MIAGADGPTAIEQWATARHGWLKKLLRLPYGIPSHDTIGRVLAALHLESFQECFLAWLQSLSGQEGWLRRVAISLLKQHPSKQSLAMKRRIAGWSEEFLMEVLVGKGS